MEGSGWWGVFAVMFGFVAGLLCGRSLAGGLRRRRAAASVVASSGRDRLAVMLERGLSVLNPWAESALSSGSVRCLARKVSSLFSDKGVVLKEATTISAMAVGSVVVCLVAAVVTGSLVFGMAASCCGIVVVVGAARSLDDRRVAEDREAIPEALRSMGTCLRSGSTLVQTLSQVAGETKGRLGECFGAAARRLEMGGASSEALEVLRGEEHLPELAFVAVALDVQHRCGGSLASVLESARESIEDELALRRSLRVQTAQAKLSAQVVTMMPFLLIALFSLMSSDFLSPFFASVAGMGLLSLALAMQLAGVLAVRHMLRVERG